MLDEMDRKEKAKDDKTNKEKEKEKKTQEEEQLQKKREDPTMMVKTILKKGSWIVKYPIGIPTDFSALPPIN